jgi:Domain of unknown function (DUF397)
MGEWTRAKACSSNSCIEVKPGVNGRVLVRRFIPDGMPWSGFNVTPEEWAAFVAGVKAGDFDHITEEASI